MHQDTAAGTVVPLLLGQGACSVADGGENSLLSLEVQTQELLPVMVHQGTSAARTYVMKEFFVQIQSHEVNICTHHE